MTSLQALYVGWSIWALVWIAAARWSAPSERRPERKHDVLHKLLTYIGMGLLLIVVPPRGFLLWPHWQLPDALNWAMVALMAAGFAFASWARITLGTLWSVRVERKAGHRLIANGPYRIVRHPIYMGLIAAGVATSLVKATPLAIIGLMLMISGLAIKARLEERFLARQLGSDSYFRYRQTVPMLLPFMVLPSSKKYT